MIIGKSNAQIENERQAFLSKYHHRREKIFALLPRRLADGRIAFMQYVYLDHHIELDYHKINLSRSASTYHLEDKTDERS